MDTEFDVAVIVEGCVQIKALGFQNRTDCLMSAPQNCSIPAFVFLLLTNGAVLGRRRYFGESSVTRWTNC